MAYEVPYEWTIGIRYLRSKHRSGFVSFVASMSVLGLGLGVAVLIVVLSVLNGFEKELRSRMLAVTSHATITGLEGQIANWRQAQTDAASEPGVVTAKSVPPPTAKCAIPAPPVMDASTESAPPVSVSVRSSNVAASR